VGASWKKKKKKNLATCETTNLGEVIPSKKSQNEVFWMVDAMSLMPIN
jgi:hypothetical protein